MFHYLIKIDILNINLQLIALFLILLFHNLFLSHLQKINLSQDMFLASSDIFLPSKSKALQINPLDLHTSPKKNFPTCSYLMFFQNAEDE